MKINTQELLLCLEQGKAALGKKHLVEHLNSYIFDEDRILTFNDKFGLEILFSSSVKCIVPHEELYKIIAGIKEEKIDISFKDSTLLLKTKSVKASLKVFEVPFTDFGFPKMEKTNKWKSLPDDFIEGISLCIFSTSKDLSLAALNNISVEGTNIISSDNYRISKYNMEDTIDDSFLLPLGSSLELIRFKPNEYVIKDNWIHFKNEEGSIFHSRILLEDFPDCTNLFKIKGTKFKLPGELKDTVEIVSNLASGDFIIDKIITVELKDGKMNCKGERESGWITSEIPISYEGELTFAINPILFSEVLGKIPTVICGDNALLFKSRKFKHLMALCRNV